MKHRLGGLENVSMGLGADNIPFELHNKMSGVEAFDKVADQMLNNALESIFADIGGFDFDVKCGTDGFSVQFGYEPAYKHDPYKMCCICSEKQKSYIKKGVADEYYGKHIRLDYNKTLADADCDSSFAEFVEMWYPQLMNAYKS